MSSREDPPRKVQGSARFAARIGWFQSSLRVGAEGPSPRPRLPWQRMQPVSSKSFFPAAMVSSVDRGALGSSTGFGAFSGLAKSGEKVVMKYARFETSSSVRSGQAGMD